jgi:2-polyprenyl-6-methoxyphenol hydroxylase-like FAD-dependent oxidoreductase
MPVRATKRGDERTPLSGEYDVLICGASFAGLTIARELQGSGRRVLMIDRYDIGERQTSACAAPTPWLANLGLEASIRQTFTHLVVHRPRKSYSWRLPSTGQPVTCQPRKGDRSDSRITMTP